MRSLNPFRRKSDQKEEKKEFDPQESGEPTDFDGFMRRGWANHSRGEQAQAESDFRRALSYSQNSIDAHFALGLVLKTQGKKEDAVEIFNVTMGLIEQGAIEDNEKRVMLRRLTLGHINELTIGDWNLEDEIWHQA
jgi:tetratricopeptide (TPR) repeat protein